ALQRCQLGLGDALGGIAVAPVLDPLDLAVEVVLELLGIGEGKGRGLHDWRRQRDGGLGSRLPSVHRQRAGTQRLLGRLDPLGHQETSWRDFSTCRAMARATRLGSAGSSTGLLRWVGLMPASSPMW